MEDQIKATITSAENHVSAAYDKLEEMGATMPTHKNIQNLKDTIYTLPLDVDKVTVSFDAGEGTPSPAAQELYPGQTATEPTNPTKEGCLFLGWYKSTRLPVPDLSETLTADDFDKIQKIVATGNASEYFNIGDEFKVTYGDYVMPFEIVGFEDVVAQVNGEEKTVHAINLLTKYTSDISTAYGSSGSTKYSGSTLRTTIIGSGYQNKLDSNFVGCLANTKVQTYSRDGSTNVVYDKLFAPSMAQLGVTDTAYNNASQAAVEGPAFAAYQDATNAQRVKQAIEDTGAVQNYWTRSLYSGNSYHFAYVQTSGAPSYNLYSSSKRVVVACNLIGNGGS